MTNRSRQSVDHCGRSASGRAAPYPNRVELSLELRVLRRRLADAWWYEEPLEIIESLERSINQCLADLRGHTRTTA